MKNYILLLTAFAFLKANAQATADSGTAIDPTTLCEIRYLYFPNMEAYYDIKEAVYHYQMDNVWKTSEALPKYYGGYSLFKNERVYITDYEGNHPEEMIKKHRATFPYNPKGRIKRPSQSLVSNDNATALIE